MNAETRNIGWKIARHVASACLLFLAYVLAALFGRGLDFVQENERVLLPQSGIALAGLIILGLRFWPVITIASLYVSLSSERPLPFALMLASGNTLAPALAAFFISRRRRYEPGMLRMQDLYTFLFYGCLLAPIVNALFAVGAILYHAQQPVLDSVLRSIAWKRWFGHSVSNLIVAPLLLTWVRRPELKYPALRIAETVLLLLTLGWVLMTVFTERSVIASLNYPVSFMPFPVMIWAALRYGPRGGATATFLLAATAVYGTSVGYGPFVRTERAEGLVLLQVYLLAISLSAMFLGTAMAERREAIRDLSTREAELKLLSARLQHAREEERAFIAREIHDELGQQLTGIKMGMHALRRKMPEQQDLGERADQLVKQTDAAVHTVRDIAANLRPGILDDLGLVAALQWLVDDFERRSGLEAILKKNVDELNLGPDMTIALFRVAQEALTNVLRHAEACSVQMELHASESDVSLKIVDDGVGLRKDAAAGDSLGIVGMRERITLLGGNFAVRSALPHGTEVFATIPTAKSDVK